MIEGLLLVLIAVMALGTFVIWRQDRDEATRPKTAPEDPRFESREFDVNNPPKFMVYRPKPDRPTLKCTNPGCYRELAAGEKVLLWPVKHAHGSFDIYCNDCVALGKN